MKFWAGMIARTCLGVIVVAGCLSVAHAQSGNMNNVLQQVLQGRDQGGSGVFGSSGEQSQDNPPDTIMQPTSYSPPPGQSRLEQLMSQRAGAKLELFGYGQLGVGRQVVQPQVGAIQDDYVLGPGDILIVTLRGQENREFRLTVTRNGQIALPRLAPISASGRTLGDFRRDVTNAVRRSYVATDAFVSVSRVRQASVAVTGEVNNPGQRIVTGLSSVVDAIVLSGGVRKSGSLRNVKLIRGGQQFNIDLYSYLTPSGRPSTIRLTDGDRVVVPPLGRTVAVTGHVRRSGIYELPAGVSAISARALIALGGGMEVRGAYNISVLRIAQDGRSVMTALPNQSSSVRDSEVLFVQPGADQTMSRTTLSGGSSLAGQYALGSRTTLSSLLKAPGALGPAPYTLFGIISRKDPRTQMRVLLPFTPVGVVSGTEDAALQSDDIVRVLSVSEARMLRRVLEAYTGKREIAEEAQRDPQSVIRPDPVPQDAATTTTPGVQQVPQNVYLPPPDQGEMVTSYSRRSSRQAPPPRFSRHRALLRPANRA